jgi:hypothetical protein
VDGDGDESFVVDHEAIVGALLEWFAVVGAIDVVFGFCSASGVGVVRFDRWYLVDDVAGGFESGVRRLDGMCCGEGKDDSY